MNQLRLPDISITGDLESFKRPAPSSPLRVLTLAVIAGLNLAAMSVSLTPSVSSPAPLGGAVAWNASVYSADPGTLAYAFRVRRVDSAFRTVVDYGPNASLTWTTIDREGDYEMEVSVRNNSTGEVEATSVILTFSPLVASGGSPVVTATGNQLVFIYSAAPCEAGSRMRVAFQAPDGTVQYTPWHACSAAHSMNFYLAGMRGNAQYIAYHALDSGTSIVTGPHVAFTTPNSNLQPPAVSVLTSAQTPQVEGVLLQTLVGTNAIATDLSGNIIWYSPPDISFVTRAQTGGTFLAIGQDQTKDPSFQFFREFDLAGITQVETNAAQINIQLDAMGVHEINSFHHDARKLRDGGYLVLANSERILTDVQGPGPVDVIGDTILVLNSNLQVTWAWDSFDHLDTTRKATLGETCTLPNAGCAPWYLATTANDWLHGNSLQLTPDGNILYSARHQDWLFKIDYENGTGSGAVLWRLGAGGDFQIISDDPSPWFSHQHDANFESNNTSLTVFDDGNLRNAIDPTADSRGQMLVIDEPDMLATLTLNADLGSYSFAVGSAQKLSNGDYHFDSGYILDSQGNISSQSVEVTPDGSAVYRIQIAGLEYRSFRMYDLYTAP